MAWKLVLCSGQMWIFHEFPYEYDKKKKTGHSEKASHAKKLAEKKWNNEKGREKNRGSQKWKVND